MLPSHMLLVLPSHTPFLFDSLFQAYEMKALVCVIDGVDEAAAMKGRIEDLVLRDLVPHGIRTIVSSRPEGVRLERCE